jgi:prevent-host-death family protein
MSEPKHQAEPWTVASAKAHLSEVIARAQTEPQTITRNGRPSVVIVSVEEWQRKSSRQGSLAAFLMESPLAGAVELAIPDRDQDQGRDVAL